MFRSVGRLLSAAAVLATLVGTAVTLAVPGGRSALRDVLAWLWPVPTFVMVVGFAAIIVFDTRRQASPGRREQDQRLLTGILELIREGDVIWWLDGHDFHGSFPEGNDEVIYTYLVRWTDTVHRFNDRRLEARRKKFTDALTALKSDLSQYFHPAERGYCRPPWKEYPKRQYAADAEREVVPRMHQNVEIAVREYRAMVEVARKLGFRLAVADK